MESLRPTLLETRGKLRQTIGKNRIRKTVQPPIKVLSYIRIYRKAQLRALWENLELNRLIKKFAEDVGKEFRRQCEETVKFLEGKEAFERLHRYAQREHPEVFEKGKKEDIALINRYFSGWDKAVKPENMGRVMDYYLPKAATMGGNKALRDLGIKLAFHLKDPLLLKEIRNRGEKITGITSANTLKKFRDIFYRMYMEEGVSPYELRSRIKGMFEDWKYRAMTIARTECGTAQSVAQHKTYRANKVKKKSWMAILDVATRDTHREAHLEGIIKMDEVFVNGLRFPLDPAGPPEEIINCRCTLVAEIEEEPEKPYTGEVPSDHVVRKEPTYKPVTGKIGSKERIYSRFSSRGYNLDSIDDLGRLMLDYKKNIRRRFGVKEVDFGIRAVLLKETKRVRFDNFLLTQRMRALRKDFGAIQTILPRAYKVKDLVQRVTFEPIRMKEVLVAPGKWTTKEALNVLASARTDTKVMTIYGPGLKASMWKAEAWRHEIGHRFYFENLPARQAWKPVARGTIERNKFITFYAQTNADEDFAEMFAFSTFMPERIKGMVPGKFEAVTGKFRKGWEAKPLLKEEGFGSISYVLAPRRKI